MARFHEVNKTRIGINPFGFPAIASNVLQDPNALQWCGGTALLAQRVFDAGFDVRLPHTQFARALAIQTHRRAQHARVPHVKIGLGSPQIPVSSKVLGQDRVPRNLRVPGHEFMASCVPDESFRTSEVKPCETEQFSPHTTEALYRPAVLRPKYKCLGILLQ